MATATVGPSRCQHTLDKDQELFLDRLSASERRNILRRSNKEKKRTVAAAASLDHLHPPANTVAQGNREGSVALHSCKRVDVAVNDHANSIESVDLTGTRSSPAAAEVLLKQDNNRVQTDGGQLKPNGIVCKSGAGAKRLTPCTQNDPNPQVVPKGAKEPESGSVISGQQNFQRGARRSSQVTLHQALDFSALSEANGFSAHSISSSNTSSRNKMPILTQGRSGVVKMMRHEPPRREAWSIFGQEDPRVKKERGEGHCFSLTPVTHDWCDACNRQVSCQALRCKNCSYTCHQECRSLIQLDCNQQEKQLEDKPSPGSPVLQRRAKNVTQPQPRQPQQQEEKPKVLSEEEIKRKIEEYNSKVSDCFGMKLGEDGIYTGFIKVNLKLRRPVTVPAEVHPTGDNQTPGLDKRTSFYLPLDAVKQLHISSTTTVSEVIQGLLKKFMVIDHPKKFALYRQTHRDGQDLFQKLPVSDHPLLLRLLTGPDADLLTFVLKENETSDVEWHAFSVPELQNFLTILEKEEQDRIKQVQKKYVLYRQKLEQALKEAGEKPG
ncbi:ras association domain-containing protein 5-like isoform X1 [Polyodon spathula]|uniref:ras association domain-containing protein 5-like isoform X1 n=1 Tax=Polyodon spathula TaxID=7913 RepID=UPI001B7E1498|nr:ras association domain-containing protein 5-like isoform X1 [Polyodon spathula]